MLSIFVALVSCHDFLQKSPVTVVFVYSSLSECSAEFNIMNTLAPYFKDNVTIQLIDAEVHRDFVQNTNVYEYPSLLYFQNGHYSGTYYGRWTEELIIDWIETLGHPSTPLTLTTQYSIRKFQKTRPVNMLIFASPESEYARHAVTSMGFLANSIPYAFVDDKSLIQSIGATLYSIQINRPLDNYSVSAKTFTPERLQRKLFTRIKPITTSNAIGQAVRVAWTVVSFVDSHNDSHVAITAKSLKKCAAVFGRDVLLQTCSFDDCSEFVTQRGIMRSTNPVFVAARKDPFGNTMFMLFPEENRYMEMSKWLRQLM